MLAVAGASIIPLPPANADTVVTTILSAGGGVSPTGAVASLDGTLVYVANAGGAGLSVIDTATNTVTDSIPGSFSALGLSPDGTRLYMTDVVAHTVTVVDTGTNTVVSTVAVGAEPTAVAVAPDGLRAYITMINGGANNALVVFDTTTNTVLSTIPSLPNLRAIVISSDGSRMYAAHGSAAWFNVSVIDSATGTVVGTIPMGSFSNSVRAMIFSADGSTIYGTRLSADTVAIIDPATSTVVGTIPVGDGPTGIAMTPDGTRIYVTNFNSDTVSVISTATNAVVSTIAVGDGPRGITITPDGLYAYVADTVGETVSVIEIDTFPAITTTSAPNATVASAYLTTHIDVTGSPTPTLAVTAGSLPPGLTFDPGTSDITGTPTTAGTYTFTLTASSSVSGIPSAVTQVYEIEVAPLVASAPLSLSANLTGGTIGLSWTTPTFDGGTPVTGYQIERSIDGGAFAVLDADTGSTGTTYTDPDVLPGVTYTYRVSAINVAGLGAVSNDAAVVVPPVATTTTPDTTNPDTTPPVTTPAVQVTQPTTPLMPPTMGVLPQTGTDSGGQMLAAAVAVLLGFALLAVRIRRTTSRSDQRSPHRPGV